MKLTLSILFVVALAAFASQPRLTVMGGDARLLLNDYLEMWAYPGNISDYQFVTGGSDYPEYEDSWFGMVKAFGGTTMGLTINHNNTVEFLVHPGSWGLIVGLTYENETFEVAEGDDIKSSDMEFDLSWGTDVALFGDYTDVAIGFGYESAEDTAEVKTTDINVGASIRGHQDAFFNLFPIITVYYNSDKLEYGEVDGTVNTIHFDIGAGYNHAIAPKTNVIAGIFTGVESVSYSGDAYEDVDSDMYITLPELKIGAEQFIGKWLVFRAGAKSTTVMMTDNNYEGYESYKSTGTSFITDFGIGLKWDNFIIDATISEDFLHDGPYMVGGAANGFMSQIAATYTF